MTRGKPPTFQRDEALAKALELFWRKGYEATGITELLETMGVKRQSFYNTFGNKESILFEAIDLYSIRLHLMLREATSQASTPLEKIDAIFELWKQTGTCGCFIGNCVVEFGATHDKVARAMESQIRSLHAIFRDIFQEAIDQDQLPAETNAEIKATTLITYGQGIALMGRTKLGQTQMSEVMEEMKQSLKQ